MSKLILKRKGNFLAKYGYARVSTKGQAKDGNSLEAQCAALENAGATIIFKDAFSGKNTKRPELDKLVKLLQEGDELIVCKLDRIARSVAQGIELIEMLLQRGVTVHILNMGILDNTPTGRLIRAVFLAFAEFERELIVERTQEGKSIARQKEGYREGRPKKFNRAQIRHAIRLLDQYSYNQVAEMTGISKSTLIRQKNMLCETE